MSTPQTKLNWSDLEPADTDAAEANVASAGKWLKDARGTGVKLDWNDLTPDDSPKLSGEGKRIQRLQTELKAANPQRLQKQPSEFQTAFKQRRAERQAGSFGGAAARGTATSAPTVIQQLGSGVERVGGGMMTGVGKAIAGTGRLLHVKPTQELGEGMARVGEYTSAQGKAHGSGGVIGDVEEAAGAVAPILAVPGGAAGIGAVSGVQAYGGGASLPEAALQGAVTSVGVAGGGALASRVPIKGVSGLIARAGAATAGMEVPQIAATGHIPTVKEVLPNAILMGGLEAMHGIEPRSKPKLQHEQFGEVTKAEDQSGVQVGRIRVEDAAGDTHVIQNPRTTGNRNAAFVKPKESQPIPPATESQQYNWADLQPDNAAEPAAVIQQRSPSPQVSAASDAATRLRDRWVTERDKATSQTAESQVPADVPEVRGAATVAPKADAAETVRTPQAFYRGTNIGDTRRIDEPFEAARGETFVSRRPESARNYGESIEQITAKPDAKVLNEEDAAFWKLVGRRKPANGYIGSAIRKGETMVDVVNDAIRKAETAGYDALSFGSDSDIGTIILNEQAFNRASTSEFRGVPNVETARSIPPDAVPRTAAEDAESARLAARPDTRTMMPTEQRSETAQGWHDLRNPAETVEAPKVEASGKEPLPSKRTKSLAFDQQMARNDARMAEEARRPREVVALSPKQITELESALTKVRTDQRLRRAGGADNRGFRYQGIVGDSIDRGWDKDIEYLQHKLAEQASIAKPTEPAPVEPPRTVASKTVKKTGRAPTETVTPADDTAVGRNNAGEQLYERANGDRYRMRYDSPNSRPNGYPDFGGDLVPVEPQLTVEGGQVEPKRAAVSDETVTQRLAGQRSVGIGELTDSRTGEKLSLSLRPDNSTTGTYSVVARNADSKTQSFRMQYKGRERLSDIRDHFEEYLNTDTEGSPFKVATSEKLPERAPKVAKPALSSDEQRLKELKAKPSRTRAQDREIEKLEADPSKWSPGDGVGWKVASGGRRGMQTNRGFRVLEVNPETKLAKIRSVADTGLTTSGGNYDKINDQWVHVADLVRDNKYNAPTPERATDAAYASKPRRDAALDRFKANQKTQRGSGGLSTEDLADLLEVAVYHAKKGVTDFADFSQKMIESIGKEFESRIRPHLQSLYEQVAAKKIALSETPETAREHKLYTGDKIYHETVTDERAITEGRTFLKENGVDAAIAHYKATKSPDAPDNAIAFAAIEELQNRERAIRTSDPKEADRLLDQHNDLVAEMAAKMTVAARGVRSVRFAEEFGEAVAVRTAQKMKSEGRPYEKLTAEETRGIADTAREMKEVNTQLEAKLAEAKTRADDAESLLASEREVRRLQREENVSTRRGKRAVTKEGLAAERSSLLADLARVTGREQVGKLNIGIPTEAVTIIGKLGRNLVRDGYTRAEGLIDELYNQVKTVLEGVTKRDVRDAFSGYGKIAEMSKDDLSMKIRELKNLSRDISSIEDIESGKRPLRSGLQRDPMSAEVRESKRKVLDKLKEHGIRVERGSVDPVAQQKSALDAVKTRLKNDITDKRKRIEQLLAGEKPPPNTRARIQYDQEANRLKTERDQLSKQLEAIEGPRKMSDEQRATIAMKNIDRAIRDAEADIAQGTYTAKQKGQPVSTPELEAKRTRLEELRKERETLKPAKTDTQFNTEARKRVDQGIKELERLLAGGAPKVRRAPIYDQATRDLQHQQMRLRAQYHQKLDRLRPNYRARQIGRGILNVTNLTRAIKASSDFFGGVVRQGRVLSADNLREAGQIALKDQFTTLSKTGFDAAYEAMKRDPNLALLQNAGVEFTGEPLRRSAALSARSEGFQYDWADKIPGVSHSQRSFDASLDLLRLKAGGNWVGELKAKGLTPENNPKAFHDLGRLINYASGRGSFGKGLNEFFAKTNPVWFAPRFRASRVQLIHTAFNPLADVHPRVRAIAMRSLAKYYGGVASVLAMGAALGIWKVSLDPDDADFLKAKMGEDTHYDFSGGESNDFRLAARLTGAAVDKARGLEARPGRSVKDMAEQYGGTTLSPAGGYGKGVWTGKDFKGDKFKPIDEAFKLMIPMGVEGVYEGWQTAGGPGAEEVLKEGFGGFTGERIKKGLIGAAKGAPGLASINVSSYREAPEDLQATRRLASKWKQKQHMPLGGASDEPSVYRPLKQALETNDPYSARLALKELRANTQKQLEQQKKPDAATEADKKIFDAVKDWSSRPFTGSKKSEEEFEASLTLKQTGQYAEAKRQMEASFERFLDLWTAQGGQTPSRTTKSPTIPTPPKPPAPPKPPSVGR